MSFWFGIGVFLARVSCCLVDVITHFGAFTHSVVWCLFGGWARCLVDVPILGVDLRWNPANTGVKQRIFPKRWRNLPFFEVPNRDPKLMNWIVRTELFTCSSLNMSVGVFCWCNR